MSSVGVRNEEPSSRKRHGPLIDTPSSLEIVSALNTFFPRDGRVHQAVARKTGGTAADVGHIVKPLGAATAPKALCFAACGVGEGLFILSVFDE